MDNLAHADQSTYRLLESETLALLEWLKRFAEGAGSV
jgi:CRISPR/Cas system CMR-associated protein Cmr5 small subunit